MVKKKKVRVLIEKIEKKKLAANGFDPPTSEL